MCSLQVRKRQGLFKRAGKLAEGELVWLLQRQQGGEHHGLEGGARELE